MKKSSLNNYTVVMMVIFIFSTSMIVGKPIDSLKMKIKVSEFIYENAIFPQSHASTIVETDEALVVA